MPDSTGFTQKPSPNSRGATLSQRSQNIILFVTAIIIYNLPVINIPFVWLATYFHEISHGLASVATGGSIVKIQLFLNGSGLCTTRGGWPVLISFSGYFGAVVWGLIIFQIAQYHNKLAKLFTLVLALLLIWSIVFYVRDMLTLFICLSLLVIFIGSWKLHKFTSIQVLLKFFALLVLLNSLQSPLYLLDGQSLGDGANLARLTYIPEIIWVLVWSAISMASFYFIWKKS